MKNAVAKFKRESAAFAAICLAASTSFAANRDWTGGSADETKYWDDALNWNGESESNTHRFRPNSDNPTVNFRTPATLGNDLYVENGSDDTPVVFMAQGENGLAGSLVAVGTKTHGFLKIAGGTYVFSGTFMVPHGNWDPDSQGKLLVDSGNVSMQEFRIGGAGNGGKHGDVGEVTINPDATVSATNINLGDKQRGIGTLTLDGGSLSTSGWMHIAQGTASTCTVSVVRGNLNVGSYLCIGSGNGTSGKSAYKALFEMSGGVLQHTANHIIIGAQGNDSSTAEMRVSGGTVTTVNELYVAENSSGTNKLVITGGTVTAPGMRVAYKSGSRGETTVGGTGTLTCSEDTYIGEGASGTLTIEDNGTVGVGYSGRDKWLKVYNGSINLNGGTLSICSIRAEKTGAAINLNGGTLYVYANNGNASGKIIQSNNSPAANVLAGGAIVEVPSGVNNTAFAVPLVSGVEAGETDGGFTKRGSGNFTLAANNTYNGPTVLEGGNLTIPASAFETYGDLVLKGGTLTDNETAEHAWSSVTIGEGATYDKNLTGVPNAADGKCILDGGTINLNAGDALAKTLTVKSGTVAIAVSDVAENSAFTVTGLEFDTGVNPADVISMSDKSWGWNYAVNAEAGTLTATAYTKYITPGSSSITWTEANAWQNEDSQSVTFQDGDIVRFKENATVAIPSETTVSPASITVAENAEVAISGGTIETAAFANSGTTTISSELTADAIALNAGTLTLANTQTPYVLPVPNGDGFLGIGEGTSVSFDFAGKSTQAFSLSGVGTVALTSGQTFKVANEKASEFTGVIDVPSGATLEGTQDNDTILFGGATIRLSGGTLSQGSNTYNARYTNPIAIAADSTLALNGGIKNIKFYGGFSGGGNIDLTTKDREIIIGGNNANYAGVATIYMGNANKNPKFDHWYSGSALAQWVLPSVYQGDGYSYQLPKDASTSAQAIHFGTLTVVNDETTFNCVANPTYMVVGERDADESVVNGSFNHHALHLTKAGANKLTLGPAVEMPANSTIDVAAGELVVNSTNLVNATVTVESGATLSGTGTVASVTFEAGAKLRIPADADESLAYELVRATGKITGTPEIIAPTSEKGKWRVKAKSVEVTVDETTTTYTVLYAEFVKRGLIIRIADGDIFLDGDAGLAAWLKEDDVSYDTETGDLAGKNSQGLSAIAAYMFGYEKYDENTVPPAIAAPAVTAAGFSFDFDRAASRSVDGIALEYAVETSDDNTNWNMIEGTATRTPPVTLAFASAGLYNRLVADIVAAN